MPTMNLKWRHNCEALLGISCSISPPSLIDFFLLILAFSDLLNDMFFYCEFLLDNMSECVHVCVPGLCGEACACVCQGVHVCVREKKRERERRWTCIKKRRTQHASSSSIVRYLNMGQCFRTALLGILPRFSDLQRGPPQPLPPVLPMLPAPSHFQANLLPTHRTTSLSLPPPALPHSRPTT